MSGIVDNLFQVRYQCTFCLMVLETVYLWCGSMITFIPPVTCFTVNTDISCFTFPSKLSTINSTGITSNVSSLPLRIPTSIFWTVPWVPTEKQHQNLHMIWYFHHRVMHLPLVYSYHYSIWLELSSMLLMNHYLKQLIMFDHLANLLVLFGLI